MLAARKTAHRRRRTRGTMAGVPTFPSMKEAALLRVLERELGYEIVSQRGSHKKLRAEDYPQLTFAFHTGTEVPGHLVKKILTTDIGLTLEAATELLGLR